MSLVISGPPSAIWIVTFCQHFPVVLWVELSQLTWNYLDLSSVTFWLMNNQTHVHNVHHVMEEILLMGGDDVARDTTVSPTCVRQIGTLHTDITFRQTKSLELFHLFMLYFFILHVQCLFICHEQKFTQQNSTNPCIRWVFSLTYSNLTLDMDCHTQQVSTSPWICWVFWLTLPNTGYHQSYPTELF